MQQYLTKARSNFGRRSNGSGVPTIMRPPPGGTAYFGTSYRWTQLTFFKHWAFIAIKIWMDTFAGGEGPKLGRIIRDESNDKKRLKYAIKKSLGGPQQHERFEPYEWNDPMRRVFRNPNEPDVAYDLWCWHVLFKKLMGISYWWVRRRTDGLGAGVPLEIWVLPSHWVQMRTDSQGLPDHYFVQSPFGPAVNIPYDEVVVFMEHSPINRWEGYAVNMAVGEWLDTYEASWRARLAQYKNGNIPSFHVQLGETYGDPDQQALDRYYAKLATRFQGESNTNKPIITGADVDIKALNISPVDMDYIANEDQIRDMVLSAHRVPKVMAGLVDNMTYGSNAAALELFFYYVNSELKYTGEIVTEKIVSRTGRYQGLEHYKDGAGFWDERTANDPEMKLRILESRVANGSIVPNQIRTGYGDDPYEHGGDDPIVGGQEMPWATGGRDEVREAIAATGNDDAVKAQVDVGNQIMEMQAKVQDGTMDRGMAVANVQLVYGFNAQQAEALFQAADRQATQDGARLEMNFKRAMRKGLNGGSGVAGGFTMGGRLSAERDEYKRLFDHMKNKGHTLNGKH